MPLVSGDPNTVYDTPQSAWIYLDRMFRSAVDHPVRTNWIKNADTCYAFEQGDQWNTSEKDELHLRNQPAIVENEIRPSKERLIGQFRRQHTTVKYLGRNNPDEKMAQDYSDLHRQIDYVNGYPFVEAEVANDMLIGGVGWLEAIIKDNELGQPQVRYRREDPFAVFWDPFSRAYDINEDARYICRSKWLYEDDARLLWPDKAGEISQCIGTSQPSASVLSFLDPEVLKNRNWWNIYFDQKHRRFRPVEIWYKKRMQEKVIETAEGIKTVITGENRKAIKDVLEELPGAVIETRSVDRLWVAVYCGGVLLDGPKQYPYGDLFPLIPYWAYRKADGEPQGWVWGLIDPQREINGRRSKAMWAVNNRQTVYERNAIKDKQELAVEAARPDGQIEIEPGKFDRFQFRENTDISQGNLSMLQEAKQAIRRMAGEDQVNPAPEVRSAAGLKRIEQSQQNGVITLFDHIRQSRRLKATLTHDLVKEFYTDEMIFQITDEPNVRRTVKLTQNHFESLRENIYDLVLTDTYDYLTSHQEQFTELLTALPQVIQYGPQWAGLLIQMSELRNKEGLMQIIQGMGQRPPVDPKVSVALQWDTLPAEQQIAWATIWKHPELAQAIAQKPGMPSYQLKEQTQLAKQKMKSLTDIEKAKIAHAGVRYQGAVDMEMQAMQNMTDLHTARMGNEQGTENPA